MVRCKYECTRFHQNEKKFKCKAVVDLKKKINAFYHFSRLKVIPWFSTLERKVKTRALKGIFLSRKWINNTLKSNSVRYHMHHRKNVSFLSSFGLRAAFAKGSQIAVFVSIVTSTQAR